MFLSIKAFEDLCASKSGKDLEKIRIPDMPQLNFRSSIKININRDMVHFYWEGADKKGSEHQGGAESQNMTETKEGLQQEGFYRIRLWKIHQLSLNKVLSNTEVTEYLLQLHRLLISGVEQDYALSFGIHEQQDRMFCFLLCYARQNLRSGLSLSAAVKRHQAFPLILGKIIKLAKNSGRLS